MTKSRKSPLHCRWCHKSELTRFIAVANVGGMFGTAVAFPISGLIQQDYGWKATFYVSGCLGIAWCVFWILLVSDDPKNNRWISQKEKDGIIKNRTDFKEATDQKPLLQMKQILCTPTIWFCALDDFGFSMALNIIMVEGPTFINDFLGKDISQTGILNALPPITSFFTSNIYGVLSDLVQNKKWLSKTASIKAFEAVSMGASSACCVLMAFSTSDWRVSVAILCSVLGCGAAFVGGRYRVPYDVTSDFAGQTFGFINSISQCSGFVAPLVTSALTGHDLKDPTGWRNLFLIAASTLLGPYLLFLSFAKFTPIKDGTSKEQKESHGVKC